MDGNGRWQMVQLIYIMVINMMELVNVIYHNYDWHREAGEMVIMGRRSIIIRVLFSVYLPDLSL
jgi:predicted nucleic-acid-binding protein